MTDNLLDDLRRSGDSLLMESFPQGAIFAFDHDLRYLSAGGHGLADVGLSRELLEGRTIFEVFPPATATAIEPLYRAALRGEPTTIDVPYGGRVYEQRLAPVTDATGHVVAGLGITHDVTEARRDAAELRETAERLRLTFDNAPIGQALVELDGRWRKVNAALCRLTGYDEDQLLRLTFQDITHPDDLDLDLELLQQLVAGVIPSYQLEKRYFTASGAVVWVLLAVSLVRDVTGEPQYFISQIQDITETKRQHEALRDLTSMLAHDLRTPATAISGLTEVLLGSWDRQPEEQRRHLLRRIDASARSLQGILDNSLTATALDARGLDPHPLAVLLGDLVRGALATVTHDGVEVDLDSGLDLTWCRADPDHLTQVVTNLVTNAVKYGGPHLSIAARTEADQVRLAFTDDGPGVPAEFVPHLFERYTRAPTARSSGQRGSGLGLSIVRDLLHLNAGRIDYADSPTGGARFTVVLPAAPPAPDGRR